MNLSISSPLKHGSLIHICNDRCVYHNCLECAIGIKWDGINYFCEVYEQEHINTCIWKRSNHIVWDDFLEEVAGTSTKPLFVWTPTKGKETSNLYKQFVQIYPWYVIKFIYLITRHLLWLAHLVHYSNPIGANQTQKFIILIEHCIFDTQSFLATIFYFDSDDIA